MLRDSGDQNAKNILLFCKMSSALFTDLFYYLVTRKSPVHMCFDVYTLFCMQGFITFIDIFCAN